jgi:hypothetical protein
MKSKLPNCNLVEILRQKAEARSDVEFDYIARLEELRHRIGGEVRFINELFPEYTPQMKNTISAVSFMLRTR